MFTTGSFVTHLREGPPWLEVPRWEAVPRVAEVIGHDLMYFEWKRRREEERYERMRGTHTHIHTHTHTTSTSIHKILAFR